MPEEHNVGVQFPGTALMEKKDVKIGLQATLKDEVWKKIGFSSAPRLWISNYWMDPMVVHNKDRSTDFEYIQTIQLSMHIKGAGGSYPVEDVVLGWPALPKEEEKHE